MQLPVFILHYNTALKNALIVIAKTGFQDHELEGARKGLMDAGFNIILASTDAGSCTGKCGSTEQASIALKDVDVHSYDRIAFIGGPGAKALADDEHAKRIAKDTVAAGKILGAICIAPTILAAAGVLKGKKATVWNEDGEPSAFIESRGAQFTDELVTVDGKIVTANGPGAAGEFGRVLGKMGS